MTFAYTIPVALLIALIAGDISAASQLGAEPQISIKQQDNRPQSLTEVVSFIRLIRNLLATNIYSLESDFSVAIDSATFDTEFDAQIQTIIERPNRFQSAIQFMNSEGVSTNRYIVTSDGQQVWIYDVGGDAYSVMSRSEFDNTYSANFLTGSFPRFLFGFLDGFDFVNNAESAELFLRIPEDELIQNEVMLSSFKAGLESGGITIGAEALNGVQYTTFTISNLSNAFNVVLLVNPETSLIDNVRVLGRSEDFSMITSESITYKAAPSSVSQGTFTFVPPVSAQLSDTPISITPF
ncbi:MAG: hypothetical protein ACFB4J_04015 [Elainellaceae cyanobacterium]